MLIVSLKRILKAAAKNFWRNSWLSLATISIMVITLFIVSTLVILNIVANLALANLQEKIDISVNFHPDTHESKILKMKEDLTGLVEIRSIEYISKDEALKRFKEKHAKDTAISQSLEEISQNPLYASFNIKAYNLDQYPKIYEFLKQEKYSELVRKINYEANKAQITKLNNLISSFKQGIIVLSLIFAAIAILVTFNTIRLAIYNYRQEIEIMKLVGATNWFIRMPFIVEGLLYGLFGGIISFVVLYPLVLFSSPYFDKMFGEINLMANFDKNIGLIISLQLLTGIIIGILSSIIAIRRYLKV